MDKLVPRLSGGGVKLCTLDMQSYLEVMGRQLDEIQAQHQQFYASRQDRLGKLRSQEHHGQLLKRWSSDSHGAPQQPGGVQPENQARLGDSHGPGDRVQQGSPGDTGGRFRSSSAGQNVVRRFLHFTDAPSGSPQACDSTASIQSPPGDVRTKTNTDALAESDDHSQTYNKFIITTQAQISPAVQGRSETSSVSESRSIMQSITPSAASTRAPFDTPETPSTHHGQTTSVMLLESPQLGTATSSRTSPLGPYAVYDASGVVSISNTTPDTQDSGCPLTASASSGSGVAWHEPRAENASPGAFPGLSPHHEGAASPSITSGDLSSVAGHGPGLGTQNEMVLEDDVSPYTFALSGKPFDGIDSEEDDNSQPPRNSHASNNAHVDGTRTPHIVEIVWSESAQRTVQNDDGSNQLAIEQGMQHLHPVERDSGMRPQSRTATRAPLVTSSLETEEALRALLATPRFALGRGGTVAVSMDAEGLEVPDDVLDALAKTDGMDLDAALGAAMGISLRECAAQDQSGLLFARPDQQVQGHGDFNQTSQGRHMVLGPGALTAAPVTVPAAVAAWGFEVSLRSAKGASNRGASVVGVASVAALQPRDVAQRQLGSEMSAANVDGSIEIDRLDVLSQTMEVSVDARGLSKDGLCDSAACAALIAAQVAAAQQQSQPVLYSLAPKTSVPMDKSSRRNTLDGEVRRSPLSTLDSGSRRNTVDGGSRRNTVDDWMQSNDYQEHPQAGCHSPVPSGSTRAAGTNCTSWPEVWTANALPSAVASAPGHGMVGLVSEGYIAVASPLRAFRGGTNMASPSGASLVVRQGGDGDLVLYGSPGQKLEGGASPSVVASPYVPPSPPSGAAPSPYISSPTVYHVASRLQRSSRKLDEDSVGGFRRDPDMERGQAGGDDGAVAANGSVAGLRSWSAVAGGQSSSRRHLTQTAASGTTSSGNSIHLDLSLTQAAAAAATGSARHCATGVQQAAAGAPLSPAISQRHLRTLCVQHMPLLQKQQAEQPQAPPPNEVAPVAPHTAFVPADLSPASGPFSEGTSHNFRVGNTGHQMPAMSDVIAGTSGLTEVSKPGGNSNRNSKVQLQPFAPPLSAFSRAAALAAAADMGMAAPPPAVERRTGQSAALGPGVRSAPIDTTATILSDSASTRVLGTVLMDAPRVADALAEASTAGRGQLHGLAKRARAASVQEENVVDAKHACQEYLELAQGQSPGPLSSASSAAKLSQLKARRRQQLNSQYGLQSNPLVPVPAATPQLQPQGAPYQEQHCWDAHNGSCSPLQGMSMMTRNYSGRNQGCAGRVVTGTALTDAPNGADVPETGSVLPLAVAVNSPLLPNAVAEAITRASCAKKNMAASGELNLGHGISGLSVAIEAGQVKWAWQTDVKTTPGLGGLDLSAEALPSPEGDSNTSLVASPAAGRLAAGESGTEWALHQLPPPQWHRHGQPPTGTCSRKPEEQHRVVAGEAPQKLLQRQQGEQLENPRRRSEYGIGDRQAGNAGGGTRQHNYAISAGGFSAQEQTQPRVPSATEGGGQPNSKAMALMRLKRQSIMRHNVQVSSVKEPGRETEDVELQPQRSVQHTGLYASNTGQRQLLRQASASRVMSAGQGDRREAPKIEMPESDDGDAGTGDGVGQQAQPKPFLRRRSAKVQARKIDWSYVKPRTNSRNPDYYGDQNSPDAALRAPASPLTSPRGGVAKPPLNINVGARAKKLNVKLPLTPAEEERTVAGAPARRRLSNIPPAPGLIPCTGAPAEGRRAAGIGAGRAVGVPLSPLDDLLAHVNTLLKDFDRIVL